MSSVQKMWRLRLFEKIIVALILLLACIGVWGLIFTSGMAVLIIVLVLLVVSLLTLLMVQGVVDRYVTSALTANRSDDQVKFQSLYERSPTSLITVDEKGNILSFNPAAVKLLGTHTDALAGVNFFDLVLTYAGHDESVLRGKISAGVTINDDEMSLKTITGAEIWVLMSVYVDDENQHRIISLTDITQAKKIDTAKSEFVALATHQLRTPVAAIRWNVELLQKKLTTPPPEDNRHYVDKIERNVMRMIALIDDFLSVSKLEMGTFAAKAETINMSEFFTGIIDEFIEKINERHLNVVREEEPADLSFTSDSRLFHVIVSNLVSNAVKYLKDGGTLKLAYRQVGDRLVIEVADDGIGIPQKEQAQLFNKFFRASNARSHQTQGTGLGLYIVKQSVEQLGGTIEVTSEENAGSAFVVSLPTRS